jgi:hypothetical protein
MKARHDHPDTSHAAAAAIEPVSGRCRQLVYDYISLQGTHGATDEEIQTVLNMAGSTQRPRRVELVEAGLVKDSGRRRAMKSGRSAIVWVKVMPSTLFDMG